MNKNPKTASYPAEKCEQTMTETVEMSEIDGIEQGAVLLFTDVGSRGRPSEEKAIGTCYGDIYVIINALYDYANMLDSAINERSLPAFQEVNFKLHAERCRKIAGKYATAIGYDYEKALERCRKRREKGEQSDDTGVDGLEALVRKERTAAKKEKKSDVPIPKGGN